MAASAATVPQQTAVTPSPSPTATTSLLAGIHCRGNVHLIVGTNPLAASRCTQSLGAGALPVLVAPETSELHYSLQAKIDEGLVKWERKTFDEDDLFRLGREEVQHVVDAVFVTSGPRDPQSSHISALCRRNRIPVNVVDAPHLCTFSLLSTHTDGPLQVGVTTNGRGCKLASRIRREIAASLPADLGHACARLGEVRRRLQEEDRRQKHLEAGDLDDAVDQSSNFNRLVVESSNDTGDEAVEEARVRRMRWLSQVCEYWPLRRLASVSDADVEELFQAYSKTTAASRIAAQEASHTSSNNTGPYPRRRGRVILAGSGPGHPDLLTRATLRAMETADLILADKLVPSGVLDLIPRRTPVRIARKFPGNADAAQQELLDAALAAYREGLTVLRLKQGDPFIYGRGGEEVAFLRANGLTDRSGDIVVLPGVTSALSAPLFAGVPPTQRDVADQVLICTGTGKKGKPPSPPEFVASRTVVFLMALHRIAGLVKELTTYVELEIDESQQQSPPSESGETPKRALWPLNTPCAVIERASCPDQRIIRTTLQHVVDAIDAEGSRPPGLLVVGAACEVLHQSERGRAWVVEDGFRALDLDDLGIDGLQKLAAA